MLPRLSNVCIFVPVKWLPTDSTCQTCQKHRAFSSPFKLKKRAASSHYPPMSAARAAGLSEITMIPSSKMIDLKSWLGDLKMTLGRRGWSGLPHRKRGMDGRGVTRGGYRFRWTGQEINGWAERASWTHRTRIFRNRWCLQRDTVCWGRNIGHIDIR